MYAELKVLDKQSAVYEVSEETFGEMKTDFRAGGKTCVYDLANGGVARVNWNEVTSLERHEEDLNRIIVGSLGGDDDGPVFTPESMRNW